MYQIKNTITVDSNRIFYISYLMEIIYSSLKTSFNNCCKLSQDF